jgi:serine/threonine protein kinase
VERFGDFELLRELGRGTAGVVYEARGKDGRLVALKVLRDGPLAAPGVVARFRAEAEVLARLEHPNIVSLYEFGHWRGQYYLTMALVEGQSLASGLEQFTQDPRLVAGRALDAAAAAVVLEQSPMRIARVVGAVARAVQHAHEHGVLHCDLKPANILLDSEGSPHVLDFGLSWHLQQYSHLTTTGAVLGTPAYMAPE